MISNHASIFKVMRATAQHFPIEDAKSARKEMRATKDYLGHLMLGAALKLRDATAAGLAGLNLSPREFGLLNQGVTEPLLTQAQLGECLGIDRTTMVAMVDRLVTLGWLQRQPDAGDRRIYRIEPTAEGAKQHRQAMAAVLAAEHSFLKPLTKAQTESLSQTLSQLYCAEVSATVTRTKKS